LKPTSRRRSLITISIIIGAPHRLHSIAISPLSLTRPTLYGDQNISRTIIRRPVSKAPGRARRPLRMRGGTITRLRRWVSSIAHGCSSSFIPMPEDRGSNSGCLALIDGISIELQAKDTKANHLRSWRVEAGPDLFGVWVTKVRFGRIGAAERALGYHFGSEAEVRSFVLARLRRRGTAKRRIGVAYRVIAASPAAQPLLHLMSLTEP
jgi:hypothetical protein